MLLQALADSRFHIRLLLVLCLLLFFPFLATRDFWELENEYAEVVRVMLIDGNYLIPKVNDTFFRRSPPFFFWMAAFFSWVAGGVSEWPVRLPSALSATELILVFYYFVRKRFDSQIAILSSVVLACSVLTVHVARHVQVNMLFYLFMVAAVFLLMEVIVFDSERRRHAYGAWLCMALACLTNGPLGLLFPAVVVGVYLAWSRRWQRLGSLCLVSGGLLFLFITIPWFAYLAWSGTANWFESVVVHLRISPHGGADHQVFFSFPLAFTPWCFLFIPAAICLWRERHRVWEPPLLFLFVWFLAGLLLSEFSIGQHNHHLFLAHIPVALGLGFYFSKLAAIQSSDSVWVWTRYSIIFFCALFSLAGLFGPLVVWNFWPSLTVSTAVLGATLAGLSVLFLLTWSQPSHLGLVAGLAAFPVMANLLLQMFLFPTLNASMVRPLAERIRAVVNARPDTRVGIHAHRINEFNYYSQIKKFPFVPRAGDAAMFLEQPGNRLLVKRKYANQIKQTTETKLHVILEGAIGSERWLLLSACKEGCDPSPLTTYLERRLPKTGNTQSPSRHNLEAAAAER